MSSLTLWSIGLLIVYLIIIVATAYITGRQVSTGDAGVDKEYFLGGYKLPTTVLVISFLTSATSAGAIMGDAAMSGTLGWPYFWTPVVSAFATVLAVIIMLRKMRDRAGEFGSMTVPEYLGSYYNSSALRIIISVACIVFYSFMLVAQFKGGAVLLSNFAGISFNTALLLVAAATAVLTVTGGLKSVAWTDFIQGIPMYFSVTALFIVALKWVGGFTALDNALGKIDPNLLTVIEPVNSTGWAAPFSIIGCIIYYFAIFISQPYLCSRFLAVKDTSKKTVTTFLVVALVGAFTWNMPNLCGIIARVKYEGTAVQPDAYTTQLAIDLLPAPIAAMFMIGVISAIITTTTSIMLIIGQNMGNDIYQKIINPKATPRQMVKVTRIFTVVMILFIWGFNYLNAPDLLAYALYFGLNGVGSTIAIPLICSLYYKKANKTGALAAAITGSAMYLVFALQKIIVFNFFVQCLFGIGFAAIAMFIGSSIGNKNKLPVKQE